MKIGNPPSSSQISPEQLAITGDLIYRRNDASNAPPLDAYRNKLINGDFEIHQRGGDATATNQFGADRWKMILPASATGSLSRQTLSDSDANLIPTRPIYCMRFNVTAHGASNSYFEQRIENVRTLQTKKATLSFWYRTNGLTIVAARIFSTFRIWWISKRTSTSRV